MLKNKKYRSKIFDHLGDNQIEIALLLLNDFVISNQKGYIWQKNIRRWKECDLREFKHRVRKILWTYFNKISKYRHPNISIIFDKLINNDIKFDDFSKIYISGNNVVYDTEKNIHRSISRYDYFTTQTIDYQY